MKTLSVPEIHKPLQRFLSPAVESFNVAAAKHIYTPPAGNAPHHVIESLGLFAVLAAWRVKTGRKIFQVKKWGIAASGIQDKLAVVLRQVERLETAGLMPDKGADIL